MSSHIFIVDDDPAIGRFSRIVLELEGFDVTAFTSPLNALQEIVDPARSNPAAIVLDLSMPELDGREFYRRARAAGFVGPVVIVSAYGAETAKQELGAQAALAKPFHPEDLSLTLQNLVYQP